MIQQKIEVLKKALVSSTTSDVYKKKMKKQLIELEVQLESAQKEKEAPTPSPKQDELSTYLEQLAQFDQQEVLDLKGTDLRDYQQYRDEDESVMAIAAAAKNSSRKTVRQAALFLRKEASKKESDQAALKKLLLRLNALLKVTKESKPDCKSCKARAGKKAISTKKRSDGKPSTYQECVAILNSLPKLEQEAIIQEIGGSIPPSSESPTQEGGKPVKVKKSKPKSSPAVPGSETYTSKIAKDSLRSVKRIVKTKAGQNPIGAYKGLCKLNNESELVKEAGGLVLLRQGLKKIKTYANGLVNNNFLDHYDKEMKELMDYVKELHKKATLEAHNK